MATKDQNASLPLKLLIAGCLFTYFLIVYFSIASLDHYRSYDPAVFIDDMLPFLPFFIIFYIMGDMMFYLPILFIKTRKQLQWSALNYFFILTTSFVFFAIFPIKVEAPFITGTDFFSQLTLLRIGVDSRYNACPSLHVSLALFSWFQIRQLNKKLSNWLIPIVILVIISTLLVKQHLFIDVIGGLIVGIFFCWLYKYRQP